MPPEKASEIRLIQRYPTSNYSVTFCSKNFLEVLWKMESVPLNFILIKDNELVISYLFRTSKNDQQVNKECVTNDLSNGVSKLTSSFIGPNDSRVPFWRKYVTNWSGSDGSQLVFGFSKAWYWIDTLTLNINGSYGYKYEEEWGGHANGVFVGICQHKGKWKFDLAENLVSLTGIGYHLQKDYGVCGGAPKLKEKEKEGGTSRNIVASISVEQCLKSNKIEFVKVESTKNDSKL